jgi:addiction module HigA family antidote
MASASQKPAPSHPGAFLREIILPALKEEGVSKSEFAELLGVGRRTLYDLLDEKTAITSAMALRLSKLLGNTPEHWMNMQAAYDLARTRTAIAAELAHIKPLKAA